MSEFRGNLYLTSPTGERVVRLSDGAMLVGRALDCDLVVRDPKISRRHLRIDTSVDDVKVTDLESNQGIVVDGVPTQSATLGHNSQVAFGDCQFRLELVDGDKQAPAEHEYIEVRAGADEPSVVESLVPGEITITHDGTQQAFQDHTLSRIVLFSKSGTLEYPLLKDKMLIGREAGCDIVIDDPAASRQHCVLEQQGQRVILKDLESKNGTWMRAQPVREQTLFNGVNFRIGDTFLVYKAGFNADLVTLPSDKEQTKGERRPVVVLPGIMGSELNDEDGLFWPNLSKALRAPEKLIVGQTDNLFVGGIAKNIIVVPNFIKLDAYSELVDFLEEGLGYETGLDLLQFPYDWRQDNRESAEKLKAAITDWRETTLGPDKKITIVCHSMGALVSRYFIECLGGASQVEKFVTLGGAHFGAPFVVRGLLYGPELLPLGIGRKGLHKALVSMPSAYQLVPPYPAAFDTNGEVIDLHKDDSWISSDYRHLLRSAAEFHDELGRTTSVPTVCIFGYGVKTVTKIQVDERNESGWEKVRFLLEHAGDNRVAERYGYLEGADIHPVKQHHGSLWNDNDVKMRIQLELLRD